MLCLIFFGKLCQVIETSHLRFCYQLYHLVLFFLTKKSAHAKGIPLGEKVKTKRCPPERSGRLPPPPIAIGASHPRLFVGPPHLSFNINSCVQIDHLPLPFSNDTPHEVVFENNLLFASCQFFQSYNFLIAMFLYRCVAPGRHELSGIPLLAAGEYVAVQWHCRAIIPSVAPAIKSFLV